MGASAPACNIIKKYNIEVNPDMGKGNRSRIERAMAEANGVSPKSPKANKKKVSGAGIFVAIAAILVVIAMLIGAIGVLNDSGWFARSQTAVETEHYRVTGTMMNYFFMTQFNSYYEYYYQLYNSYFKNSYDSVYDLMGIDPAKSLKSQYMSAKEGEEKVTYFDYYMGLTETYVTQMLTYCEFANKNGIALDDEDTENINKSIENLKKTYESQKAMYEQFGMSYYSTFSAYLAATYGTGVKERDVRAALELITLAAKFEEKLNGEKKDLLLSEEDYKTIEEYAKNNPSSFLMADYYTYSFKVVSKDYENDAAFEAAKKDILEQAKKLSESTDKEAYKASVIEMLKEAEMKAYREANWSKYLKENDNDEAKAEEKLQEYFEKTYTAEFMDLKFDATMTKAFKHPSTPTDVSKWIFGYDASACEKGECEHDKEEDHEKSQDPAKKGDMTYFENTSTKEETVKKEETTTAETTTEVTTTEGAAEAADTTKEETTTKAPSSTATEKVKVTTYTVTVYLLDKEGYRNSEITKHFGYVMFSKKADAEAFYAEYSKGEMNKDTLVEVLNKMYEENNTLSVYAYDAVEDYLPGDLEDQKVDGADKWLETAKPGENSGVIELVVTTTSSSTSSSASTETKTTYYAVLVYDKDGYEAWFNDALTGAIAEEVKEWFEENTLKPEYNKKAYKYIDM